MLAPARRNEPARHEGSGQRLWPARLSSRCSIVGLIVIRAPTPIDVPPVAIASIALPIAPMPASTSTIIIIVVIIIGERLAREAWDDPSRQSSQTCDAQPPHEAATIRADRLFLARQSLVDHGFLPAQAARPALGWTTRGGRSTIHP